MNGIPLLYYTLSAYQLFCQKHEQEFSVIDFALNTDSVELVNQFIKTNISGNHIKRKKILAGDFVGKMDVIQDTLHEMETVKKVKYDVIIDLDLTSPIRKVKDIWGTLNCVLNDKKADVAYSVTESRRSPYFNMVSEKENGYFDKFIASEYVSRQQTPKSYDMNASIYAYRREYLQKFDKIKNRNSLIWEMPDTGILDIDSEWDFELLQVIMTYFIQKDEQYKALVANANKICNLVQG